MSEVLTKLNEEIFNLGVELLRRRELESNNRKSVEIMKLSFKSSLDKTIFKNEELREMECMNQPSIKSSFDNLRSFKYETDYMQLEYEAKLRLFQINLKI